MKIIKMPHMVQRMQSSLGLLKKSIINTRLRFIVPFLFFIILKSISAILLLQRVGERDILSIFHGWDSYYYMSIATSGYPNEVAEIWAFFPLYPYISKIVNSILRDVWFSTSIISLISGVFWIPIYQSIAERYVDLEEAFYSTCFFASFPHVFLFTSVAYSESLFLLITLGTWLLFLRGNFLSSWILASLATLSRPYGILISLPMFLELIMRKKVRNTPQIFLPLTTLIGWLCYNFIKTGDYFAFVSAQKYWIGQPWQPGNWFREFILPLLNIEQQSQTMTPMAAYIFLIPFVTFTSYLIIKTFSIDWKLCIYGMAVFITSLSFGTPLSAPRFIPFIFPIWLNIRTKKFIIGFSTCAFFYIHSIAAWFLFYSNIWIG